jgi:SPX domain protein involved in polyphosphate accumulation
MKYGQKLVEQSVPKWSLHNVDYNSLKHEIKVHTTRDQARAIAIPGQDDRRLARFESRLYGELCAQHQRVGLFVVSKAGELERRLGEWGGIVRHGDGRRLPAAAPTNGLVALVGNPPADDPAQKTPPARPSASSRSTTKTASRRAASAS